MAAIVIPDHTVRCILMKILYNPVNQLLSLSGCVGKSVQIGYVVTRFVAMRVLSDHGFLAQKLVGIRGFQVKKTV